MPGRIPTFWVKWDSERITAWITAHADSTDQTVQWLIEDMEDELDKRTEEMQINPPWDAREGDRPYYA